MVFILKVIEAFSGIGSQRQALENINADFEIVAISEWDIRAMFAYDIMHNGKQNLKEYRHHTKESLGLELMQYTLSSNGKTSMSVQAIRGMPLLEMKAIMESIDRNNNLVDITKIHSKDLPDSDVLTYSFPCQDLSVGGNWHHNSGGIDRDAHNRSTLLWQVERLLKEYKVEGRKLPQFLLMENVSAILAEKHRHNFNEWCTFLSDSGYVNQIYTLNAENFGVPQSRVRTYMISVLADDEQQADKIKKFFKDNNLENKILPEKERESLDKYLKLDYSNEIYKHEAIKNTPVFTESRKKIYELNKVLAVDNQVIDHAYASTITTKQDRHPNSGIIRYDKQPLTDKNTHYRNLTARECFLLMGFKERQYDFLLQNNFKINDMGYFLTDFELDKLAGNSIVVQVLEAIFTQIIQLKNILEKDNLMYEAKHNKDILQQLKNDRGEKIDVVRTPAKAKRII